MHISWALEINEWYYASCRGMKIRNALIKDLNAILEILNYEIVNSIAIYDYDEKSYGELLDWFQLKQENGMPVIVAEIGDVVVGFGTYDGFRKKEAYQFSVEHSVYIQNTHRRIGVGRLLLEELIQRAKERGYHAMIAGLDASNKGSYEFHKKHGFKEVGTFKEVGFKFNKWLDLTFMQLLLLD